MVLGGVRPRHIYAKLLSKLTDNKEVWVEALHDDICLAEIKGRGIRVFPGDNMWVMDSM